MLAPVQPLCRRARSAAGWVCTGAALVTSCSRDDPALQPLDVDAGPPWDAGAAPQKPIPGMVWIPPGVLIAGTPPERLPRIADEEMAGEQVVMGGFYIDTYPFPNEAGAIPTTNVTQAEAEARCTEQGKRLCTELEYERACKGPNNLAYPYGDRYRPEACASESGRTLVPNGFLSACRSDFGMHDPHGSVWSWTASRWGRGTEDPSLVAIRGGSGEHGELVGRCANGRPMKATEKRKDLGFRCCKGEVNTFEVVLSVSRGEPLRWQPPDDRIAPALARLVPPSGADQLDLGGDEGDPPDAVQGGADVFTVERMWVWHPLGNEELLIGGGCAPPSAATGGKKRCGVLIARMRYDRPLPLAYVSSERWEPTLGQADGARELFLFGGDDVGAFRKRVRYEWGRIGVAEKERKKRRKGEKRATYD